MATNRNDKEDALQYQDIMNAMNTSIYAQQNAAMGQQLSSGLGTLSNSSANIAKIQNAFISEGIGRSYPGTDTVGVFKVTKVVNGYILAYAKGEGYVSEQYICRDGKELADMFLTCLTVNRLEK